MIIRLLKAMPLIAILSGCSATSIKRDNPESVHESLNWVNSPESSSPATGYFSAALVTDMTLSPGDRVSITIPEGDLFSGIYEVNADGTLQLPLLPAVRAAGGTSNHLAEQLKLALVQRELFLAQYVQVFVTPQQWAVVQVLVTGAVFSPGRHLINERPVAERIQQSTQQAGDYPTRRFLSEALRAAGGVRPDADLARVELERQGAVHTFDLRGIFSGSPVADVPLVAGDQVRVPAADHFQVDLMRPSQITPRGFQVFISNLTTPSNSNAQAAVGKVTRSMPYGTRLLRGLVAANCVGGTQSTNASRRAVYISTDRRTNRVHVQERDIGHLLGNASNLNMNPYLMPDDGIACFDSGVTNIRDIARSFTDVLNPLLILELLEQ